MIKTLDIFTERPQIFEENWKKGGALRDRLNHLIKHNDLVGKLDLLGEDCFLAIGISDSGLHKSNVARTFLLQELVRRGQLFQGLFYPTPAHDEEALADTLRAWEEVLPIYAEFLLRGKREQLVGDPVRPVFRAFNSCECLQAKDCENCMARLKSY